jgi:hypothetical protein
MQASFNDRLNTDQPPQPYQPAANLRKFFRKTMAAAFIGEAPRSHIIAAEKPRLAA